MYVNDNCVCVVSEKVRMALFFLSIRKVYLEEVANKWAGKGSKWIKKSGYF